MHPKGSRTRRGETSAAAQIVGLELFLFHPVGLGAEVLG